jgi:hypothetical protein
MIFQYLHAPSPHLIFGSRHARCQISRRDLPSLWSCMTWAASWVITGLRLRLLRPRGCRALSAQLNRQTRSRVFYLANWRRIENGLAKVSERGCYVTHLHVRWLERISWRPNSACQRVGRTSRCVLAAPWIHSFTGRSFHPISLHFGYCRIPD